jgi:cytochrome c oxidase subunit IV
MSMPVVPQKTYFMIFCALIGLTALTTGVAFMDLGPFNTIAALAIAFSKMLLVLLFFMGLKYSGNLMRTVVIAGFFWLALLIGLAWSDYQSRPWTPSPAPWSASAPPTHP